ncbi:bifunctional aminoglycoside phosphotransferase/ATP-binding protein [Dietzia psychralcaliphila]|uniref:bifunctional aminoglycoside phosphotransferase/ATP-binding protein n=1 Tax=Dietzia psychralcaliphila TaxID=139021 RepID=UPI001C1E2ED8|nr:AAA family ATPase [Dietzia psychralcaliphila]
MDTPADADPVTDGGLAVVETHSALIVLYGDEAHKVRKRIDLGFLDNRTVEARAEQSRREVELNSRLAPDVYDGVLEVRGPDGEVIDHVVRMRRLPSGRSLESLVRSRASGSGRVGDPDLGAGVREVARQLDHLHAASPHSEEIDAVGTADAVAGLWRDSIDHLRRLSVGEDAPEIVDDVEWLAGEYLRGRDRLLRARIETGRVVDGHGDLLAADVYLLDDGPRVIDCLEFDDRLRFGDAMLDAGFLAMDLDRVGARDLAAAFLAAYRDFSGDDAPSSLVHHYIGYRALVRAKVTAIRAEQSENCGADARLALALADRAVDALLRARVRLILVGGVSGSGKSTLAAPLAVALGAELLRSDELRFDELGSDELGSDELGSDVPAGGGAEGARPRDDGTGDRYSEGAVSAVYSRMLARAGESLALGRSVVLDATWLDPRRRAQAETVAADAHAELVEISCTAPHAELVRRIEERGRTGTDPSEATVAVLESQLADLAPWPDAIEVDTTDLDSRSADAVQDWAARTLGPLPWA